MEASLNSVPLILVCSSLLNGIVESDCACADFNPGNQLPSQTDESDCAYADDGFAPTLYHTLRAPFESDCACADDSLCTTDNDCACPTDDWAHTTHTLDETIAWQRAPALYRAPLPDNHELVLAPRGFGVIVLNAPARRVLDAFTQARPLPQVIATLDSITPAHAEQAARTFAALGLLRPLRAPSVPMRTHPHTLTAWLHVTNACNLRCAYCYVDKTNEVMHATTGIAAVNALFRSAQAHGFRAIKLKYAGGEPSLNFPLVLKLHAHARHLADATGIELREVMLSNGTALTETMLDVLREAQIRLMISLDGIGAPNDAQRASADGHGSYARIARTIERALARGIIPHLSITVTAQNAAHLAETVQFALERELPFNLNFVRHQHVSCPTLIRGVRAAFAIIENHLPKHSLLGILDRARLDQPHTYTCGVGRTYIVIDHRGHIARCHMKPGHTVGDVWHDDPLTAVQNARGDFQNIPADQKDECRDCTWKYWCAGGCPLLAFKTTGQINTPSPYCHAYKALYPELVRLEGLRLLRWQHN
jgi:uncharacterized protein